MHFPVAEAWFPIVQSRLLGATNVCHRGGQPAAPEPHAAICLVSYGSYVHDIM